MTATNNVICTGALGVSRSSEVRAVGHFSHIWSWEVPRSICRRSNDLWQDAMKWWTFGDMKNGLDIYECYGQLERFRNGSSRAFTPQSQPDPFRNRSTAITSRGGRLVLERPDAVEQVWTRAPGCVPEPFRSQSCGVNTALVIHWGEIFDLPISNKISVNVLQF